MAEINALLAAEAHSSTAGAGNRTAYYPVWKAPIGSTTILRFMPDLDETNALPWVEKKQIRLPFAGIANGEFQTEDSCTVTIPCMETWGGKCPITEAIRPLWKGSEEEKALARKYYRKPSFIMACLVISGAFNEPDAPDNPIRLVSLNRSIHDNVRQGLAEPDIEMAPWDFAKGRDFKVVKTQQGQWANYSKSTFAFKPRPLEARELAAIEQHGLFTLAAELGAKPDAAQVLQFKELYGMSLAGEAFDAERYPHLKAWPDRVSTTPAMGGKPNGAGRPISEVIAVLAEKKRNLAAGQMASGDASI